MNTFFPRHRPAATGAAGPGGGGDSFWAGLTATSPLSPSVQEHLVSVYATLANVMVLAVAGSYVHGQRHTPLLLGLQGGLVSTLAGLACLLAFAFADRAQVSWRRGLLYGFGFLQGLSLGPLLEYFSLVRPQVLTDALTGTALMFGAFTLAALYSSRRAVLYTAGGWVWDVLVPTRIEGSSCL